METQDKLASYAIFNIMGLSYLCQNCHWIYSFSSCLGSGDNITNWMWISSLKLIVELFPKSSTDEEHLLYLTHLDEQRCDATLANEIHKKCVKAQYDKSIYPRVFSKGDLVLVYDQDHDMVGACKFEPHWHGP